MTNLTHDEIIAYALRHDDEVIRDLATRFQAYRDTVNHFIVEDDMSCDNVTYEPIWPVEDVPMFLKKQAD